MKHYFSRGELRQQDSRVTPVQKPSRPLPSRRHFGDELTNRLERPDSKPCERPLPPCERLGVSAEVGVYLREILGFLTQNERKYKLAEGFMESQEEVNGSMRAMLVDWLVEVHLKFKLVPESLFLAVNILDRFLSGRRVERSRFQMLGVSALLIAAKCEDIFAPLVKDLVYLTDYSCTKEEVLRAQGEILTALGFDLTYTSPLPYLHMLAHEGAFDRKTQCFANYLLELALLSAPLSCFQPRELAAAACFIAGKIFRPKEGEGEMEGTLRRCVSLMFRTLLREKDSSLQGIRKKFASAAYESVSQIYLEIRA